ncbi:MAG: UDP-N-acetylmuramate dehydrogenase [Patescibacteria group bacterium]|nr:UDP-N-acetylmuramate dehydrogenase [Patescibacteria group bacterium]
MNIKEKFKNIELNKSLKGLTTFKVGGGSKYYLEILDIEELQSCVKYCNDNKIEFLVLGWASNVLISDNGFDGLIIKLKNQEIKIQDSFISVSAGTSLSNFLQFTLDNNFIGAEFLAGIPGTLGGAIYGNAGIPNKSISDILESALCVSKKGKILEIKKENCKFSYRNSIFKENKYIIYSAKIILDYGDTNISKELVKKSILERNLKQPIEYPSAGSFFKNVKITDELKNNLKDFDVSIFEKSGIIPAGFLIEKAQLKGFEVGGAKVSEKHANFLINYKNATAGDIYNLSKKVEEVIFEKYKIKLEPEVQLIGKF